MKTIVDFSTAKLLKEKGYNNPHDKVYSTLGNVLDSHYPTMSNSNLDPGISCTAPTIGDVIIWFYEKQGIWIVVNVQIDDSWYFELYNLKDSRNAEIRVDIYDNIYENPTEAYQAAITYNIYNII